VRNITEIARNSFYRTFPRGNWREESKEGYEEGKNGEKRECGREGDKNGSS
jgi:hypothetical protein